MGYKGLIRAELKPALCGKRIFRSNIEKFRKMPHPSHRDEESGEERRTPFIAIGEVAIMPGDHEARMREVAGKLGS